MTARQKWSIIAATLVGSMFISGFIILIIWLCTKESLSVLVRNSTKEFAGFLVNYATATLGFVVTVCAIYVSLGHTTITSIYKSNGYDSLLWSYLIVDILILIILLFDAFMLLFETQHGWGIYTAFILLFPSLVFFVFPTMSTLFLSSKKSFS